MKVSELMKALEHAAANYGDVEVYWQSDPKIATDTIVGVANFFVVPERYEEEIQVNIRSWPY
jgi:hypothetical protein